MKRVMFLTLVVVLLGTASTAFAAEPQRVGTQPPEVTLGDVWAFYFPFGTPGIPVDAYLYRPSTLAGWPFVDPPSFGTWWWTGGDSEQRRQSWPAYQNADMFGWYYAEFMMPRDEVWFPCGFPLKWRCNYVIDPWTVEYHSPANMVYEPGLFWPWLADPMDTVSPLEVYLIDATGAGYIIPFEVTGMYWKWTDIP